MSRAGQLNGRLGAVIRTADRIGYWVRWRVHAIDRVPLNVWPAQDFRHRSTMSGVSRSRYFPLVIKAFGCQLGTAFGLNMTLSRGLCPRISLHSSSNSKW
jgi:hypothetical protein